MTQEQNLTMYSTTWCPDCHRAKAFLKSHGLSFEEIDIEKVPEAAEIVASHNDGKHRVPTLQVGDAFYGNPPLSELGKIVGIDA